MWSYFPLFVISICIFSFDVLLAQHLIDDSDPYHPYLVRTNDSSGNLYSPYFLWNTEINNNASTLTQPIELYSANGYLNLTLHVQSKRIETDLFNFTTRVFCIEDICRYPGPTLFIYPGDKLFITLINDLESSSTTSDVFPFETFYPNRTNLFFPTLPLNSSQNSPFFYLEGDGDSFTYSLDIPSDISPGFHWYQSRVHRISSMQVMGGLFGAILIYPHHLKLDNYPLNYTAITKKLLVFSHLMIDSPQKTLYKLYNSSYSFLDDNYFTSSLSLKYLSNAFGSSLPLDIVYKPRPNGVNVTDSWLTNGLYQPTITLQPGQWYFYDILIASTDRIVELELNDFVGSHYQNSSLASSATNCTIRLMGKNGLYYPRSKTGKYVNHLTLLQGERASIALLCPNNGTFYLQSISFSNDYTRTSTDNQLNGEFVTSGDYQTKSNQVLMILQVSGNSPDIRTLPEDLSFISNVSSSSTFNQSSSPLSFSTAQNQNNIYDSSTLSGLCLQTPDNYSLFPENINEYHVGIGVNCRLPCYDSTLCEALLGPNNYLTSLFPTTINGNCSYATSSTNAFGGSSLQCLSSETIESFQINGSLPNIYEYNVTYGSNSIAMEIYGHHDYQYPLFVPGFLSSYQSYEAVNSNISNIIQRDKYSGLTPTYSHNIYESSGDFNDLLLPLPGRTQYTLHLPDIYTNIETIVPLLTSFLKYEDRGFVRYLRFSPGSNDQSSSSLNSTTSDNNATSNSTSSSSITTPDMTLLNETQITIENNDWDIPVSMLQNSDSAYSQYLCKIDGSSFYYNETIDLKNRIRILQIHSCPNHFSLCQSSECGGAMKTRALIHRKTIKIPLYPNLAASSSMLDTTCITNSFVGVALNGVQIYGPGIPNEPEECVPLKDYPNYEININRSALVIKGRTSCTIPSKPLGLKYCQDILKTIGSDIDKCGGYAPAYNGTYRYHVLPTCLYAQLTELYAEKYLNSSTHNATSLSSSASSGSPAYSNSFYESFQQHSPQVGWALDGYPIYGPLTIKGIAMKPCHASDAHPQLCLDSCSGYYGRLPHVDQYLYRYYLPSRTLSTNCSSYVTNAGECGRYRNKCCIDQIPTVDYFPYTIGCLRGCKHNDSSCQIDKREGYTSSFQPFTSLFVGSTYFPSPEITETAEDNSSNTEDISIEQPSYNDMRYERSVLHRRASDRVLEIYTVNASITNSTLLADPSQTFVSSTILPTSSKDAFVTSLAYDKSNQILYYTSQSSILAYHEKTKTHETVIAGIVHVDLLGYYLGLSLEDVLYIRVQGQQCTSIIHYSSEHIHCIIYQSSLMNTSALSPSDVELRTIAGSTRGISLDAYIVYKTQGMRPVLHTINFFSEPFSPLALTYIPPHPSLSSTLGSLYWTNGALASKSLQRSNADGSQIETILQQLQISHSIVGSNIVFNPQNTTYSTLVNTSNIAAFTSNLCDLSESEDQSTTHCLIPGHIIFFSDALNNQVVRMIVPLSNTTTYYISSLFEQILADPSDPNPELTSMKVQLHTTTYPSKVIHQETSVPVDSNITQTILFTNMTKIQSLALDFTSDHLLLTTAEGLVISFELSSFFTNQFTTTQLSTLLTPTTNEKIHQITANNDTTVTSDTIPSINFTLASGAAQILPITHNISWPIALPSTALIKSMAVNSFVSSLPWAKILALGTSDSRWRGLAVIPLVSNTSPLYTWKLQRYLLIDTSKENLLALSEYPLNSMSILSITQTWSEILFPSQILYQTQTLSCSTHSSFQEFSFYLSEYLGRIWKIYLVQNCVSGKFEYSKINKSPELIFDQSTFMSSVLIRSFLQNQNKGPKNLENIDTLFVESQ